ncbi:hypothetical protein [Methanosarcina lacustris]|nr:hypothetical protein [Methanosarcina lacustris]
MPWKHQSSISGRPKNAGENKEALSASDAELAKRFPPRDEGESI